MFVNRLIEKVTGLESVTDKDERMLCDERIPGNGNSVQLCIC